MQNAKSIPDVHKMPIKEENLPICYKCQVQLPNCWIRDFESFDKKKRMPNLFAKKVGVGPCLDPIFFSKF